LIPEEGPKPADKAGPTLNESRESLKGFQNPIEDGGRKFVENGKLDQADETKGPCAEAPREGSAKPL
jgi:hypothetical protein